jgi:hypothetical protein
MTYTQQAARDALDEIALTFDGRYTDWTDTEHNGLHNLFIASDALNHVAQLAVIAKGVDLDPMIWPTVEQFHAAGFDQALIDSLTDLWAKRAEAASTATVPVDCPGTSYADAALAACKALAL